MSKPYLEFTYRQGKPFAAYLYLERQSGDHAVRTEPRGKVLVDYSADGRPIGIEMTALGPVVAQDLRAALRELQVTSVSNSELAPLEAA